jgi:hypothetical protein
MDQGPLVRETIDAGTKFLAEFEKRIPIEAAFWLKEEDRPWRLYIASSTLNDHKTRDTYSDVWEIGTKLHDPNFEPSYVRLIGTDNPQAQAAIEVLRRYPGRIPARYRERMFGDVWIEEVFIYPVPIAVA